MLDYEKSSKLFERAYQQNPNDFLRTLNHAESLITVDRAQEAFNLAPRVWNETTDTLRRLHSWTIRILSLFFLGDQQEGLNQFKDFLHLVKGSLPIVIEKNEWVYNKIRKYLNESSLKKHVKNLLNALIDLLEKKISVDDFEQELNKFSKCN